MRLFKGKGKQDKAAQEEEEKHFKEWKEKSGFLGFPYVKEEGLLNAYQQLSWLIVNLADRFPNGIYRDALIEAFDMLGAVGIPCEYEIITDGFGYLAIVLENFPILSVEEPVVAKQNR